MFKSNLDITYDWGILRCVAGFMVGMICAEVYRRLETHQARDWLARYGGWVETITLIICAAFITWGVGRWQFFSAPLIAAFVIVFAFDSGPISKFLSHRVFGYLARISYSVYMTHLIFAIGFFIVAKKMFPGVIFEGEVGSGFAGDLWLLPYLTCVIVFAHFTYRYIEVPGAKLLGKKSARPSVHLARPSISS